MANHSYLRVWTRDFSTETMIAEFARFLTTAPLSTTKPGFTELIVQPVDPTEAAAAEWDLRAANAGSKLFGQHVGIMQSLPISLAYSRFYRKKISTTQCDVIEIGRAHV